MAQMCGEGIGLSRKFLLVSYCFLYCLQFLIYAIIYVSFEQKHDEIFLKLCKLR